MSPGGLPTCQRRNWTLEAPISRVSRPLTYDDVDTNYVHASPAHLVNAVFELLAAEVVELHAREVTHRDAAAALERGRESRNL